jgi:hypothetical protein
LIHTFVPKKDIAMKKPEVYLKEYCTRLSEDNLKKLYCSLNQRMSGDLADALVFMGTTKEMDKWFSSAGSSTELYDMIDMVGDFVNKEYKKRYEGAAA